MSASRILIVAEDIERIEWLRGHKPLDTADIHWLGDRRGPARRPDLVVSAIRDVSADRLDALAGFMDTFGADPPPHIVLTAGAAARLDRRRDALRISAILHMSVSPHVLAAMIRSLLGPPGRADSPALESATRVSTVLGGFFLTGHPATQAVVSEGSRLIGEAIEAHGVRNWIDVVETYDDHTHRHSMLVAGFATSFAASLGFGEYDRLRLTKAAVLHDVGKITIPVEILNKPGALSQEERQIIELHPRAGYDMLVGGEFEDEMLDVILSHHEKIDGSGYPRGLADREIPDLVRLITVCDIYAALIERRAYKTPLSPARAYAILRSMRGLDPVLLWKFEAVSASIGDPAAEAGRPVMRAFGVV